MDSTLRKFQDTLALAAIADISQPANQENAPQACPSSLDIQAYKDRIDAISVELLAVWGWVMFIVHTLLTGIIATRIM